MYNSYCDRKLTEVNTKHIADIVHPHDTIIIGSRSDGIAFKFDIGRVCYLDRESGRGIYRNKTKPHITGLVDTSTLSAERIEWLKKYLSYIDQKGLRDDSLLSSLSILRIFFDFCDSEGSKPVTLNDLASNYKYYQIKLYQRNRLSSEESISASYLYSLLNIARDFIQIAFELSDIDMLNIIPKHRHTGYEVKERKHSLEDFKIFIKTCITYFNEFSDALINNLYPIPITLPYSSNTDYYWLSALESGVRALPNCFDDNGDPFPFEDIRHVLAIYCTRKDTQKKFYKNTLVNYRNEWMNGRLDYKKIYAYNLCAYCFYHIYLAFTAANVQPTLDLRIFDLHLEKLGSSTFAKKHKYRAGRKVEFSASPQLKRYLIKYLKIREMIDNLNLSGSSEHLFVRIGENRKIIRFSTNSINGTNKDSPLFKQVKRISPRDIRNLCAEYYVKHSKGNLSIVARKLNNSLATTAKSYTSIDIASQAIEMNKYHEEMSNVILRSNRTNKQSISVKLSTGHDTEKIPTGSCSNLSNRIPIKTTGFNEEAPNPSCATFESCLFCDFFAVHVDFEDIHKLLSLKSALLISSTIRNDHEHHLIVIEPSLYRIDEIINVLQMENHKVSELVREAKQQIDMNIYNEYWSNHIDFLTTVSQYNEA